MRLKWCSTLCSLMFLGIYACSESRIVLIRNSETECCRVGTYMSRKNDSLTLLNLELKAQVEEWLNTVNCPIIRVDGTRPVEENISRIIVEISQKDPL